MNSFKEKFLDYCKFVMERKIELMSFSIDEITMSMENETKSSVGDKHETARARMQFEREKLGQHLSELKAQAYELEKIDLSAAPAFVSFGKLVETDKGLFFIAIPLGKVEFEAKPIYVVSPVSPLATEMKGRKEKEEFEFNKVQYKIISLV